MIKLYRLAAVIFISVISNFVYAGSVDLGDASGYTLVIKNDFTYKTGDVQGYSAIGGDITNTSGQQDYFDNAIELFDIAQPTAISDFTQTFDYLSNLSTQLAGYAETGTTTEEWGTINFTPATGNENQDVHIFNVDFDDLYSAHTINYNDIESGQVIVNVTGTGSHMDFGGQYFNGQMLNYSDATEAGRVGSDIMYNFVDALSFDYNSTLYASVLAPSSDITATGAATFWGQVIANSWTNLDASQFNYDLFANVGSNIVEVSEPSTIAILLVLMAGLIWRSRQFS